MSQAVNQVRVVSGAAPVEGQSLKPTAFFDEDGEPVDIGGGGGSTAWGDVTGKPSTFPPASHDHAIADVDGLQAALDAIADRLDALEETEE